jgi:glycine/D-amino acid oxidase-like deaminating enzyme
MYQFPPNGAPINTLESDNTEQADLRGGRSPWFTRAEQRGRTDITDNLKCDALIVGGGITGSLVAERLTRQGLDVIVIDREFPGRGSTAASTSMLLWEIDRSLTQLTEAYGFERASHANRDIAYRWAGTFDTTRDGLPLIGPVPGEKGIFAAYGYGGNGITFSFLAAQLIGGLIAGEASKLVDDFALDRDGKAAA